MKLVAMVLFCHAAGPLVHGFGPKALVANGRTGFGLAVFKPLSTGEAPDWFGDASVEVSKQPLLSSQEAKLVVQQRHAAERKKWGVDNAHSQEYWFDNRIHTLGNVGLGGALHAALAPLSTKLIDVCAYDGVDVRAKVAQILSKAVGNSKARVLDLCCGVGISTRALHEAFPDAETVIGLDTSPQMIAMANFLARHLSFFRPIFVGLNEYISTVVTAAQEQRQKISSVVRVAGICKRTRFLKGNSEGTELPDRFFDLVTIMYAFHEVPKDGRHKILEEARRLLKPGGTLAVVDITSDYTPSPSMLMGEPYVIEYQKNIHDQIQKFRGFLRPRYETVVPGHVGMWLLQRA